MNTRLLLLDLQTSYIKYQSCYANVCNFQIEADDSLPKYICTNCLESLKFAMNFKKTCEASDKKFRKILHPTGELLMF